MAQTAISQTYRAEVAPIIAEKCQSCHQPNSGGLIPLMTYEDVQQNADLIRTNIVDRTMPPALANADSTATAAAKRTSRTLTDEQIATILHWMDAGMPRGDTLDHQRSDFNPNRLKITSRTAFHVPHEASIVRTSLRSFVLPALFAAATAIASTRVSAQMPLEWRDSLVFHTFSIAAIDPRTGEVGVAVTTRVPCVGNGVPWVRAGVGAVATQASTRTEYGNELLDALARGETPADALKRLLAADSGAAQRQIGVIDMKGRTAQHTGTGPQDWKGHRTGPNYVTQGNVLVGPQVLEAVARSFEASEGQPRHLADRLIDAIAAGHALGGDQRHGLRQSAAVIVADPRPGRSRRTDGVTANISVCENPQPVAEMRRIYDAISQTLGYRTLEQFNGGDVWQLKVMLQALGFYRANEGPLDSRAPGANTYGNDAVAAVDAFRASEKLGGPAVGSPSGLVDPETVTHLWAALERAGKATAVRQQLLEVTAVRR